MDRQTDRERERERERKKKEKKLIVKLIVIDLPAEAPALCSIFSMSGIEFLIKLLSARPSLLIRDVFLD